MFLQKHSGRNFETAKEIKSSGCFFYENMGVEAGVLSPEAFCGYVATVSSTPFIF